MKKLIMGLCALAFLAVHSIGFTATTTVPAKKTLTTGKPAPVQTAKQKADLAKFNSTKSSLAAAQAKYAADSKNPKISKNQLLTEKTKVQSMTKTLSTEQTQINNDRLNGALKP